MNNFTLTMKEKIGNYYSGYCNNFDEVENSVSIFLRETGLCLIYKQAMLVLLLVCGKASYCCAAVRVKSECWVQWGHLIMGEHGCAVASLWLEHAPSISLAIGPRHPSY